MTNEQAATILRKQQEKLNKLTPDERTAWVSNTADYVKALLGESSKQFDFIKDYAFWQITYTNDEPYHQHYVNEKKPELNFFLEGCIETIQNLGVHKTPKHNFLYTIKGEVIIASITLIGGAIFYIGTVIGKQNCNTSLSISPALEVANSVPKKDANSNKSKVNSHTVKLQ